MHRVAGRAWRRSESKPMEPSKGVRRSRRKIGRAGIFAICRCAEFGIPRKSFDTRAIERSRIFGGFVARVITRMFVAPGARGHRMFFLAGRGTTHIAITGRSNIRGAGFASGSCRSKRRRAKLSIMAFSTLSSSLIETKKWRVFPLEKRRETNAYPLPRSLRIRSEAMPTSLVRCSNCKRHIYQTESSCPFCAREGITTPIALAAALTAAAGLAMAGCGGETAQAPQPETPQPKEIATTRAPDPGSPVMNPAPAYGGPPPPMDPQPMPSPAAYGAPPPMPTGVTPVPVPVPPKPK
jgi:hypothetical protein